MNGTEILTIHLFPELNRRLIDFLKQLSPEDWQRQTVAKLWKVKDVAAHLLDGNFRRIALHRDKWMTSPDKPIGSYQELVDYLNQLNADWVKATKRLSPQIIIELLASTNEEVYNLFSQLDPLEKSVFPVGWAGQEESQNWFDIAREYTERWLHQQQIRDALGNKDIMSRELYYPLLDIFMYAWPVSMGKDGDDATVLKTIVTGEGGGRWILKKAKEENGRTLHGGWELLRGEEARTGPITAETIIDGDVAWKLFSKSLRKEDIRGRYEIKGDRALGEKVLNMISVMA